MATNHNIYLTAKDHTRQAFNSVSKGLGGVKKSLFNVKTALAGVVGAAGFGLLIKNSLTSADALAKTADKLGVTTQALAGLQHAAELSGVSTNTLNMALQRMTRRVSEAALGTGEAKEALKELGLDAQRLAVQSPDQTMKDIADAMQNVTTQADKVRLSMKLFDSEGVALVNTLQGGAASLRAAEVEARQLGITLSRYDTAKVEQANDAWTKAKKAIGGVANKIAVALAPYLTWISTWFTDAAKKSNGFAEQTTSGLNMVKKAILFVADSLRYMQQAWQFVKLGAVSAFDGVLSSIAWVDQSLSNLLNKIPGLEFKPSADLQIWAQASKLAVDDVAANLQKLLAEPMPSEGLQESFAQIEKISNDHATRIAAINEKKQASLIKLTVRDNAKLEKFNQMTWQGKTKVVAGELETMTRGVASSNKTMFEINKAAGIANAVVNTAQGVTKSLSEYPYPISIAMAAGTLAAGIAQINAIKSQSFGGGGGAPSLAGSGGAPGGTVNTLPISEGGGIASSEDKTKGASQKHVTINLQGNGYTTENVRELIEKINDQFEDGARIKAVAV